MHTHFIHIFWIYVQGHREEIMVCPVTIALIPKVQMRFHFCLEIYIFTIKVGQMYVRFGPYYCGLLHWNLNVSPPQFVVRPLE